ncbi:MAG: Na(+)/H(+) antiporter subunit B [Gammaproteobacteria bacterium]|nr:Na(+)/H(+) antiporter subunit B [Gammaproteobacteria bacterium]
MRHHLVLRVICKLLVPLILLFALYVQFHGDFGPGGGFQAGVIFGAGFILYGVVFGLGHFEDVVNPLVLRSFAACGLLLYLLVGVAGPLMGGNYLDYDVLLEDPVSGQHLGILLVELGVGMTVAAVMISLFYAFADRRFRD